MDINIFKSKLDHILKNNRYIEPREYQKRIVIKTLDQFYNKKAKSVLVESPTGSGKSIIVLLILKIMKEIEPHLNIGWISMRRNLLKQIEDENKKTRLNVEIYPISMYDKNPPPHINMFSIDEAAHDSTSSMAHLHNICKPQYILGNTACPFRTDRVKLCFNNIIKDAGIGKLIYDGYLSQYAHYTIPNWNPETVCEFYLKDIDRWGQSIMYFHRLVQCYEASNILAAAGIKNEVIVPNKERYDKIDRFVNGEYPVLINCMLLTEGFNHVKLQSVFVRHSAKSPTIQMSGRVLRKCKEIPLKNVIQPEKTKWPFIKTALPKIQYIYKDNRWLSLSPNEDIPHVVNNSLNAILKSQASLPQYIEEKKAKMRKRREILRISL